VVGYWEYWAAGGSNWQPLAVQSDSTNCLTRSGIVLFDAPAAGAHVASQVGALRRPTDPLLFWLRYRIDQVLPPGYQSPPMLEDVLLNIVAATNAVAESNEVLGASDGLPNQTFTLANVPILPKDPSVKGIIQVIENKADSYVTWTEVPDFAGSGPFEKHYTIDLPTGTVTFGDGKNGKIPGIYGDDPSQTSADVPNIRATIYQWGGGAAGNVGANTITTLTSVIPYLGSVTNLRPAAGGQDEESVDHARARAPALLRTRGRAVTAQDFADLAIQTRGAQIVRAHAMPLYNPTLSVARPVPPGITTQSTYVPLPGVVTVLVIPYSSIPNAAPSAETLQLVATWLDSHRLITTEVFVRGPDYRKVEIRVSAIADPKFPLSIVTQSLTDRLLAYFSPTTGGDDGTGWAFGQPIYASETLRQILITPGVLRIVSGSLMTYVDDLLTEGDVSLAPSEVVYSIEHTIMAAYS
jgi:predicted phage baseplate assembly protein